MPFVPVGFDRADGVTQLPNQPIDSGGGSSTVGTPSPAGKIIVRSNSSNGVTPTVEEDVDSPEIERAEQATSMHSLKMSWQACINYIAALGRGTFVRDSYGNTWRILSSKIKAMRSGDGASKMGQLTYTAESISFDSPPDDYQMIPVELGLDILKHPRYSWALLPYVSDKFTYTEVGNIKIYYTDIKQTIIRIIQTYRDAPIYPSADNINGTFQSAIISQIQNGVFQVHYANKNYNPAVAAADPVTWNGFLLKPDGTSNVPTQNCVYFLVGVVCNLSNPFDPIAIALAAAFEVISKLWRGEDTPYVVGFEVTWSQYYFAPVYENPGGYAENPVGIVPDYFISPSQNGNTTIFDLMGYYNPQCYSVTGKYGGKANISWLRKADEVEYQRTWFKVTRKWVGAPIGSWDPDLYTQNNLPTNANNYNRSINPMG